MPQFIAILTENKKLEGAYKGEAPSDIAFLNDLPEDQLRQYNWTVFIVAAASTKHEMISDGRIDEVLED